MHSVQERQCLLRLKPYTAVLARHKSVPISCHCTLGKPLVVFLSSYGKLFVLSTGTRHLAVLFCQSYVLSQKYSRTSPSYTMPGESIRDFEKRAGAYCEGFALSSLNALSSSFHLHQFYNPTPLTFLLLPNLFKKINRALGFK